MNLDTLLQNEGLNRFEGEQGVKNLAILCRNLGYQDSTYFGQFSHRGCYGDLIHFLEDHPGIVEDIVESIRQNQEEYGLSEEEEIDTMGDDDEGCG